MARSNEKFGIFSGSSGGISPIGASAMIVAVGLAERVAVAAGGDGEAEIVGETAAVGDATDDPLAVGLATACPAVGDATTAEVVDVAVLFPPPVEQAATRRSTDNAPRHGRMRRRETRVMGQPLRNVSDSAR